MKKLFIFILIFIISLLPCFSFASGYPDVSSYLVPIGSDLSLDFPYFYSTGPTWQTFRVFASSYEIIFYNHGAWTNTGYIDSNSTTSSFVKSSPVADTYKVVASTSNEFSTLGIKFNSASFNDIYGYGFEILYLKINDTVIYDNYYSPYVPTPDNLVTNPSFTLPCGWYAEFSNIQDSIIVNGSSTFSGSIGWQDNTNSYFYGIDSDNQSTTTQRLQWNKVNAVLGFTKNGSFSQSFSTLSKYVIVNPAYMVSNSSSDLGRAIPNPSINISVVGSCVVTLKSFSTTPYFNNYNQNYDVSIDSTNGTELTLDPDDGLFYDSDGDSVTPNQGGLTDISSYSNDYQNNLLGLVRSIQDLLNRGQDEVSTLSQSGSGFMSVVRQMFGWLPSDVVNVVTSSLIVIVVIGMLKVFL